ncbi:MAG: hypothetical protein ACRC46_13380 [Thermoguttaceae bacterium]
MKFDPYDPCPGGRQQKLKFCCTDLHKELEKLYEMQHEGDFGNLLQQLDRLAPSHQNCACLDALRANTLMALERYEEAYEVATTFRNREPENFLAVSIFSKMSIGVGRIGDALNTTIDAIERLPDGNLMQHQVAVIMDIANVCCRTPLAPTSITLAACAMQLQTNDAHRAGIQRILATAIGADAVPLRLREFTIPTPPKDFVANDEFRAVIGNLFTFRWKRALAGLRLLKEYVPVFPRLLLLTARIQIAMLDNAAATQALTEYIALPNLSDDDRLDAEVLRRVLAADPIGDGVTAAVLTYTLTEDTYPIEVIASSRRIMVVPPSQDMVNEDGVAPLRSFVLLDRPRITELPLRIGSSEIDTAALPRTLAVAHLFGKQTDRPTQLTVVPINPTQRPIVETLIRELFSNQIVSCDEISDENDKISVTNILFQNNYHIEQNITDEQLDEIVSAYTLGDFVDAWVATPLELLDGKRPCDVVGDASYTWPLRAAVEIVGDIAGAPFGEQLAARLRERLGLPAETKIEISDNDLANLDFFDSIPIWRWHRLDIERLPHPTLVTAFNAAISYRAHSLITLLAEEILSRPMGAIDYQSRAQAFEYLKEVALSEHNVDEALGWIERARNEAATRNVDDCHWDCAEFYIRMQVGPMERANELLTSLSKNYADHPEVQYIGQQLSQLAAQHRDQMAAAASSPQGVASQVTAASSGASPLWTPDQPTAPPTGGASPIWTP